MKNSTDANVENGKYRRGNSRTLKNSYKNFKLAEEKNAGGNHLKAYGRGDAGPAFRISKQIFRTVLVGNRSIIYLLSLTKIIQCLNQHMVDPAAPNDNDGSSRSVSAVKNNSVNVRDDSR